MRSVVTYLEHTQPEPTPLNHQQIWPTSKMCYERLRALKCGHYESYHFDFCSTRLGRACKDYRQYILRQEKHRSCYKCKAEKMTAVGVASPSLAQSEQKTTAETEVAEGSKDAAGAGDQTMEDECWEKHLL